MGLQHGLGKPESAAMGGFPSVHVFLIQIESLVPHRARQQTWPHTRSIHLFQRHMEMWSCATFREGTQAASFTFLCLFLVHTPVLYE